MRHSPHVWLVVATIGCLAATAQKAAAFEGRISAVTAQGGRTNELLYTVGTNLLRVEMTATNWPYPVDILDLDSGMLTLFFPNNRSFVHLKPASQNPTARTSERKSIPMPSGNGTPSQPNSAPGISGMPGGPAPGLGMIPPTGSASAMPDRPIGPLTEEKLELKVTGKTTNILGFACQQYEIQQRREVLDIWATDRLAPYQSYISNQPHRFGPRQIEEQWPAMLASRKLFPLLVTRRVENGADRLRFRVTSVTEEKLSDDEVRLFAPPPGYVEIQSLPF